MMDSSEAISQRQATSGKQRSFLASLAVFFLFACLAFVAFVLGVGFQKYLVLSQKLPSIERLKNPDFSEPTQIFADNGDMIGEFYRERRYVVPLKEIPPVFHDAFVAAEGEDLLRPPPSPSVNAIVRAAINVIRPREPDPRWTTYRSMPRRTPLGEFLRAIEEFVRAINQTLLYYRIRIELAREQILYLYINQIYLGSGAYGVEAAARTYFGKSVKDLTIAECAMIAGLAKAPGRDSPKRNMQRALERRSDVLQRMSEKGKITQAEYEQATHEEPVLAAERTNRCVQDCQDFVEHVRKDLVNKFGADMLYKGGLKVHTTFDPALARTAQEASPSAGYPVQHTYIKRIVDKRGKVLEDNIPGSP